MFAALFLLVNVVVSVYALPAEKQANAQIVTQCTVPNTVALTFDDGPYLYLYDVSNTLRDAGAVGTFFFNGNNYRCIYDEDSAERVKFAYENGHQIASHTWNHDHLTGLSWDQLHDQFWRVEQALQKIAGVVPAFMRPPYGEYNDLVLQVAAVRGQAVSLWDFDSEDSLGASAEESKRLYDAKISEHPNTLLALNHEVYESTAHDVLPYAIRRLQEAGYRLVSLSECVGQPAYQSTGNPGVRDDSWHC